MYFNILGYLPYGIMLYPICMCAFANKCRRFFSRNNFPLVESHLHSNVFYHLVLQTNKTLKSVSLQIALMSVELNQIILDLFSLWSVEIPVLFYFKGLCYLKNKASLKGGVDPLTESQKRMFKASYNHCHVSVLRPQLLWYPVDTLAWQPLAMGCPVGLMCSETQLLVRAAKGGCQKRKTHAHSYLHRYLYWFPWSITENI